MDKNLEPAMSARIATLLYLLPEEGQKINFLGKIPLDDIIKADPISSTDIQSITNVGDGKFAVQDAYFDIPFEELTGEQQELMVAKALIWSNDNMKKNGAIISMYNALDDCRAILGNEFPLHKVFLYTQILDGTLLTKVAYNEENNKYFAKDDEGDAYDLTEVDSDTAIKIAGKAYISVLHQQLGDEGRITLNKPFKIWDSNGNPYTIKEIEEDKYGEGIALTGDYTEKNGKVFENEYISGDEILINFSVSEMKKLADHAMKQVQGRGISEAIENPSQSLNEVNVFPFKTDGGEYDIHILPPEENEGYTAMFTLKGDKNILEDVQLDDDIVGVYLHVKDSTDETVREKFANSVVSRHFSTLERDIRHQEEIVTGFREFGFLDKPVELLNPVVYKETGLSNKAIEVSDTGYHTSIALFESLDEAKKHFSPSFFMDNSYEDYRQKLYESIKETLESIKKSTEMTAKEHEHEQSETPGLTATEHAVVYSVFKNVFQNLPDHYDIADVKEVAKGVNPYPERIDGEELSGIVEEMLNVNSLVVQNKNLTDRQQSILKIESNIVGGSQKMAEFLKPEINTHDSLEFDGQKWPLRSIVLPHTGENVLIGTEALEQALHPDEWNGRKAQAIYERIFYYVSDKDLQQPAAKLAAQVEKEALGLGDIISLNGDKLEVGMKVIWNDPDESARDLSRVWTIDNINGEVISISDGYSEAEVTANELTTYKGEMQEKTQEESDGQHASISDIILRANELGIDYHPVNIKDGITVTDSEGEEKTFNYAYVSEADIILHESMYDCFENDKGVWINELPEYSQNEILDKLFDAFFAEKESMLVVYDKQEVPSYAMSAIFNGDFSGIENEQDEKDIRAFMKKNEGYFLDVKTDSQGFSRNPAFGLPTDCETVFMIKTITPKKLLEEKKAQVIKEPEETLPLTPAGDKIAVGVKVTWQDPDIENRDLSRVWQVDKINGEVISISDGYSEAEVTANELNVVDNSKRSYGEVFKEAESLLQKFLPNYGDGINFRPDDAPDVTRNTCAAFIVNTGTDTVNVIHDYSDQFSFSDVSKTEGQKIYEIVPVMSVFQQSDLEKYITAMKEHGDEAVELYNLRKEVIDDLKERVIDSSGYSFSPEAVQRIRNYSKAMFEGQEKGEYGMAIIDSIKDIVWKDPEVARKPDKWFTDAAKEFDSIVNGDDLSNQMRTHFHR